MKKDPRQEEDELVRSIVMRLSRGVSLQLGRYLTKEQLDEMRERVLAHRF